MSPTKENWENILEILIEECVNNYENIDWNEVNQNLEHFPNHFRVTDSVTYLKGRLQEKNKELYQKLKGGYSLFGSFERLYSVFRCHKIRGGGKGQSLSSSYLSNLTHLWFYYRESEEHQMELSPLFSNKDLVNLEQIKFQSMYFSDYTENLIKENITNFPKLKRMIFCNMNCDTKFLEHLSLNGIEVICSKHFGYN